MQVHGWMRHLHPSNLMQQIMVQAQGQVHCHQVPATPLLLVRLRLQRLVMGGLQASAGCKRHFCSWRWGSGA